jgi:hypothetical protein
VRVYAVALANDSSAAFMGASSNGSGLYASDDTGRSWMHLGWQNVKAFSMDMVRSTNGRELYMACGNGVLHSIDFGERWKLITDWRISEVMDVAINQRDPSELYIATAHGPWRSNDGGKTWKAVMEGLRSPYVSRVVYDTTDYKKLYLATEEGLFTGRLKWDWQPKIRPQLREIRQLGRDNWAYASEPDRTVSESSFGRVVGGKSDYMYTPFGVDHPKPAVLRDEPKNIASSVAIGPIFLVGSLDGGVVRESMTGSERRLPTLPRLEIWTLKSFLVFP